MPRTPVPSATGEHPCAADHPRTPLFPALCAFTGTPSVTPEPFRRLLLAWFTPSPSPVGRSTIRAMRCSSGTRTNWAGRQCPGRRYDSPPACASTSWTCRRRRGTRRCGTWAPGLRWRCTEGAARVGSGCGSWWPRGARTSCRGCSTGWSGGPHAGPQGDRRGREHRGSTATCCSTAGNAGGFTGSGLFTEARCARGRSTGARHTRGQSTGGRCLAAAPEPGCEVEPSLPTLSAFSALPAWQAVGGVGGAPDLVRLVDTLATQCHRVRLRRACAQPLAFS